MKIENFEDLLRAARAQPEPQRLLFVFAKAALPENCTQEQRAQFDAGQGGELVPLMSVDKTPEEIGNFQELAQEALRYSPDWAIVFVAGLDGRNGVAPTSNEADQALEKMIESLKSGRIGAYLPFDRQGTPMLLG